jgi:phosphoribosylformylglycinamidine synthase subunit PurS
VPYLALVNVMPKPGVADPQGQTIERSLPALGYSGVSEVRVGKRIELTIDAESPEQARERVEEMCESFLANPVLEIYRVAIGREGTGDK